MNDNIDTKLEQTRPMLSKTEQNAMYAVIETKLVAPIPSPYMRFVTSTTMTPLLIALLIALGTSGTVMASDSAKPGDLLFPIDRISEEARLAITAEAKKDELRQQFAAERLAELREIIKEEKKNNPEISTSTDESFVSVDAEGEVRVTTAAQILMDYLDDVESGESKVVLWKELLTELNAIKVAGRAEHNTNVFTDDSRIHIKDDRIELRENGYRVRIEKDGEVRIKKNDDNSGDDHQGGGDMSGDHGHDESDDDLGRRGDETTDDNSHDENEFEDEDEEEFEDDHRGDDEEGRGIERFEVRVEDGRAEVHLKYDGREDEYVTAYTSETALIAEVALRTGLASADLTSALDLEIR